MKKLYISKQNIPCFAPSLDELLILNKLMVTETTVIERANFEMPERLRHTVVKPSAEINFHC